MDSLNTVTYSKETDSGTVIEARALFINRTSYETILTAFLFFQLFMPQLLYQNINYIAAWNKISHWMSILKDLSKENNYSDLEYRVFIFIKTMIEWTESLENILISDDFPLLRKKKMKKMPVKV